MGDPITLEEFIKEPVKYAGRSDELNAWSERSFKQQMQDIYGEAHRLIRFYREDKEKLPGQWDVFDMFCSMTCLDSTTTRGERETLRIAEWELYNFVFGDNVFRNDEQSVMRWFNQWMYDLNYSALAEG